MLLIEHKTYLPSFYLGFPDQTPVCIYTILSVNEAVKDCAAYRGVAPNLDKDNYNYKGTKQALLENIKAGADKIRESEARELFPEIETMGLRYRK